MADERSGFGPEEPPPIDLGYLSLPEDVQRQAAAAASTCPFCRRIAAGEYDYHDAYAVAFQPLNPLVPGHFLVVPREHIADAGAEPETAARAAALAAELAGQMELESYNLITSAGAAATQSVWHQHWHIVPRRDGDGLHLPWSGQRAAATDLPACERCQGSGSEPIPDPDEAAGLILVSREDLRELLASCEYSGSVIAEYGRLADAAGLAQ